MALFLVVDTKGEVYIYRGSIYSTPKGKYIYIVYVGLMPDIHYDGVHSCKKIK